MKVWTLILFTLLLCFSCGKKEKNKPKVKKETNINYGYDSITWINDLQPFPVDSNKLAYNQRILDNYYQNFWVNDKVSGGLLVAQNGKIIFERYTGFANRETQDSLTANTPLHIASISKVLTSLAILKLVDKKIINLNESITKYFPDFPYPKITVENLLNHRSGLPNYTYFMDHEPNWNSQNRMENKDVLASITKLKIPLNSKPGTHFSYSNTNYVLLALIIEKITKMPYPKAMQEMVFKPLGMKNTFVFEFNKDSARVAPSYTYKGTKWPYDKFDATYGDKNIYSTPRDLLQMDIAMYSPNFLSDNLKQKAWKGYSYESKGIKNYGLGIRLMEFDNNSRLLYHNGWWHGNYSTYVRGDETKTTIIALGNRRNRTIYSAFSIIGLFGDYPLEPEELDEKDDSIIIERDTLKMSFPKKKEIQSTEPLEQKNDSVIMDTLQNKVIKEEVKNELKKKENKPTIKAPSTINKKEMIEF